MVAQPTKRAARIARNRSGIDKRLETVRGILDSGVVDARTRADNAQNSANGAQGTADAARTRADDAMGRTSNIQAGQLGDRQVARGKVAVNAIGISELASGSTDGERAVTGAHIRSGSLARSHFGSKVVPYSAMADDSVGVNNIVDGHVTTSKLANNAVTRAKYVNDSVGADAIDFAQLVIVLNEIYRRIDGTNF